MMWPPKAPVALAIIVVCALHGAAFWWLHTPARKLRSAKILRVDTVLKQSTLNGGVKPAVTSVSPQQVPKPVPQPMLQEALPLPADTAKTEDAQGDRPDWGGYTPSTLLDVQPIVIQDVSSDLPELVGLSEAGTMVLTLLIGASGAVDDVKVESSDLPEIFVEVARRDFLGARFNPGMRNGQAVPSSLRIEVTFGSGVESESTTLHPIAPAATTGQPIR